MKLKYFIVFLFLQATIVSAQEIGKLKPERNVPAIVMEKFKNKFPAGDPVWFSQYQGRYDQKLVFEGRFIFDNRYSSVIYGKEGNMIAFAATIEKREIPAEAAKYMADNFPTYPIADALLVTRGSDDITYELGIYIDNQYVIKVFNKDGKFIKSTRG